MQRKETLAEFQARLRRERNSDDLMSALLADERAEDERSYARDMGVDDDSYLGSH